MWSRAYIDFYYAHRDYRFLTNFTTTTNSRPTPNKPANPSIPRRPYSWLIKLTISLPRSSSLPHKQTSPIHWIRHEVSPSSLVHNCQPDGLEGKNKDSECLHLFGISCLEQAIPKVKNIDLFTLYRWMFHNIPVSVMISTSTKIILSQK